MQTSATFEFAYSFFSGVEILQNKGILVKGQTWNTSGCEFYFHGPNNKKGAATCPPMARPVCYVYNGAVCCASHCPGNVHKLFMCLSFLSFRLWRYHSV